MIYGNKEYLDEHFEKTKDGYIAYKIFGRYYGINPDWKIKKKSILKDFVDRKIHKDCSYGINVATTNWLKTVSSIYCFDVWEVLIPNDAEIVIPIDTHGKIRTNRIILLRIIKHGQKHRCLKCSHFEKYEPECKKEWRWIIDNRDHTCPDFKRKKRFKWF